MGELASPLHNVLNNVHGSAGGDSRPAILHKLCKAHGRGSLALEGFGRRKRSFIHHVTLSHRDPLLCLCVYNDTSEVFWSRLVAQMPYTDMYIYSAD